MAPAEGLLGRRQVSHEAGIGESVVGQNLVELIVKKLRCLACC